MQIDVKVQPSLERLAQKFQGFENILLGKLKDAIWGYGLLVERESKLSATELIYNQPSSPNYVRTGRLRSTIATSMGIQDKGLSSIIQPNVEYAVYVHEGTRYMMSRPFMKIGADKASDQGEKLIISKINEATEQLAREVAS
jgi:hypothetical protein